MVQPFSVHHHKPNKGMSPIANTLAHTEKPWPCDVPLYNDSAITPHWAQYTHPLQKSFNWQHGIATFSMWQCFSRKLSVESPVENHWTAVCCIRDNNGLRLWQIDLILDSKTYLGLYKNQIYLECAPYSHQKTLGKCQLHQKLQACITV